MFRGDKVRDGVLAEVVGFGIGVYVAKPLLGDDKGNEKTVFL